MALASYSLATGFKAVNFHVRIIKKSVKQANCDRPAANTGRDRRRELAKLVQTLLPGFITDDALQITDHRRKRVRPGGCTKNIVGGLDVRDPVAQRLIDRVFQCARAVFNGDRKSVV